MFGSSIYVKTNPALTGGSPQHQAEAFWLAERRKRLHWRAGLAAVALIAGSWLVSPVFGLALALAVAAGHTLYHWRRRAASRTWRRGSHGERETARILRWALPRARYRVLRSRRLPGEEETYNLVVGPGGLWVVDSKAWHPEARVAEYAGRLFVEERPATALVDKLSDTASTISHMISRELGRPVDAVLLIAVHGGSLPRGGRITAEGVTLLRPLRVPSWIKSHPVAEHSPAEVEEIARVAARLLPPAPYR
ncbi:nuclease-related domain-containing protein [Bailinhaonella thermotolerans]|uniref:NERD domain-containing protein n=1 Tax=Bailinhaonella thermotolerans TaxID=1070861 RepID=A0A3A4AZE8_9ACTN|nr:nuclease-related domain-containing protein [Bailinhaonella thermotolerans]RJL36062.1 NERD domain-containing protein [Bailinhaonella thermotolerans]